MEDSDLSLPPRKRAKLDDPQQLESQAVESPQTAKMNPTSESRLDENETIFRNKNLRGQDKDEKEVGITHFINPTGPKISGLFKHRYTDFLVNEIQPSGEVLHLRNIGTWAASQQELLENEMPPTQKSNPLESGAGSGLGAEVSSFQVKGESHRNADLGAQPHAQNLTKTQTHESQPFGANTTAQVHQSQAHGSNQDAGSTNEPKQSDNSNGNEEEHTELERILGQNIHSRLLELYRRLESQPNISHQELGKIQTQPISEKFTRGRVHALIRLLFNGRLCTSADSLQVITIELMKGSGAQTRRKNQAPVEKSSKSPFYHFSLYKEGMDTMQVIGYLSHACRTGPKMFQFAGTKDRRGCTVQRVSVQKISIKKIMEVAPTLRGSSKIGDFTKERGPLSLGELDGNEFTITLRDCEFEGIKDDDYEQKAQLANNVLRSGMEALAKNGFINYFGLQRFGTFAIGTHTIGKKILQSDWQAGVEAVLSYDEYILLEDTQGIAADDKARAQAIADFYASKMRNSEPSLENMPRRFAAERAVITTLANSPPGKPQYEPALKSIPNNLRSMYLHAYQSWVWNAAVSHRWQTVGATVVVGDLVLVREHKDKVSISEETVDAEGEVIIHARQGDSGSTNDDRFERARPLSSEEVSSGQYTIFDVVLPTPGFDIIYPKYLLPFYQDLMAQQEFGHLDPLSMRRPQRENSLPGSYRKILARPGAAFDTKVLVYTKDDEQLVKTDLEVLEEGKTEDQEWQRVFDSSGKRSAEDAFGPEEGEGIRFKKRREEEKLVDVETSEKKKLAAVIKFQLGTSTYATMALRELMKDGGLRNFQPEFSR